MMKFINSLSLSTRICGLFVLLVGITSFSARSFFVRQERNDLELRLQEKAAFINQTYSMSITAALLQKDDVMLLQVINILERDQEISSVIVVDQRREVRYHADPQKIATTTEDPLILNTLKNGEPFIAPAQNVGGRALILISPLRSPTQAAPLGAVRIEFTFRRIEAQLQASQTRYWFIILGASVSTIGFVLMFFQRWILGPMLRLKSSLAAINASVPEPNLPEPADEIGEIYKAVNDLVLRFKTEGQQQWANQSSRAEQEKAWIQRLMISFLPGARIVVADKDNRVISDTGEPTKPGLKQKSHLLDLIRDANFATLLTSAFEKEGEVVRGSVTFQEATYEASILSVPLKQAAAVKTLIALQPK